MTSKELLDLIKKSEPLKRDKNGYVSIVGDVWDDIVKDLEDYEELKNLMGTPIQDIMKRLKVLDILKPYIELSSDGIISCHNLILIPYYKDYEEQYNLLKEWLDGINK